MANTGTPTHFELLVLQMLLAVDRGQDPCVPVPSHQFLTLIRVLARRGWVRLDDSMLTEAGRAVAEELPPMESPRGGCYDDCDRGARVRR